MNRKGIGVGFLGAGPATQSIHIPAIASLGGTFRVQHVMDVDETLASRVAGRCGARFSATTEALLDDPDVDVVVICSPHRFHASQTITACQARKKLVLCEKPMATSLEDAEAMVVEAKQSGVPVLIGTMHAYDPAWRMALQAWQDLDEKASLIRSAIYLPPDHIFLDQATNMIPPTKPQALAEETDIEILRTGMLVDSIHTVPLIRELQPRPGNVRAAAPVRPFGFSVASATPDCAIEFTGLFGNWPPSWSLRVTGRAHDLHIEFPPSYVLGGSSVAHVKGPECTRSFAFQIGGYRSLWSHVRDIVTGAVEPDFTLDHMLADYRFALDLAVGCEQHVGAQS